VDRPVLRPRLAVRLLGAWSLAVLLAVLLAGCASDAPSPPAGSAAPSSSERAAPSSSASAGPVASPPSPGGLWSLASRAIGATGRLRVIVVGGTPDELRIEPRASAAVSDGMLLSVCVDGRAYEIDGFTATPRPARWTCGSASFISAFRRTGQPREAWNASMPVDSEILETVVADGRDRWRWEYAAISETLGGPVRSTLLMDAATGRLLSGTRSAPDGDVRWTFSYTTIFLPVQLP